MSDSIRNRVCNYCERWSVCILLRIIYAKFTYTFMFIFMYAHKYTQNYTACSYIFRLNSTKEMQYSILLATATSNFRKTFEENARDSHPSSKTIYQHTVLVPSNKMIWLFAINTLKDIT